MGLRQQQIPISISQKLWVPSEKGLQQPEQDM